MFSFIKFVFWMFCCVFVYVCAHGICWYRKGLRKVWLDKLMPVFKLKRIAWKGRWLTKVPLVKQKIKVGIGIETADETWVDRGAGQRCIVAYSICQRISQRNFQVLYKEEKGSVNCINLLADTKKSIPMLRNLSASCEEFAK